MATVNGTSVFDNSPYGYVRIQILKLEADKEASTRVC